MKKKHIRQIHMEFAWLCQAKVALCHVNAVLLIWVRIDMYLD